jgi:hypothetical protein
MSGRHTVTSIAPRLMTKWEAIQFLAIVPPLRHERVHKGSEAIIVMPHKDVRHLVDDDVLKAMLWFFCELRVKANGPGAGIAASPLGFHLLHVKPADRDAHYRRPSCNKGRNRRFDLFTVKLGNNGLLPIFTCFRTHAQEHLARI